MKVKVCGMKYPENINAIQRLQPDFMGFIFYEKSPRYMANDDITSCIMDFKQKPFTVGVFVNCPIANIMDKINLYALDYVQLHGKESITYVKELFNANVKIIKAFSINENFDWISINQYADYVSYFLFDTATENYGGSGLKFDWSRLKMYKGTTPFFLSGGIAINDIPEIKKLTIPQLYGIDVNSKFELKSAMKNVALIKTMINQVRNGSDLSSK